MHERRKHLVDEVKDLLQSLENRVSQLETDKSPNRGDARKEELSIRKPPLAV